MLVTFNSTRNRFEVQSTYQERFQVNPLVKQAGYAFDRDAKVWHTAGYPTNFKGQPQPLNTPAKQAELAARLLDYCDGPAKTQMCQFTGALETAAQRVKDVEAAAATKGTRLTTSRATDSDRPIPVPDRINPKTGKPLAYLPYQRAGIAYAMDCKDVLIADEMGLGKTIQAIGVSNCEPKATKILIIAPRTPKINWRNEWKLWDVKGLSVGIADPHQVPMDKDVVIINFDLVMKFHTLLTSRVWDIKIVDECHKIKNPDALRTKHIMGAPASKKKVKGKMVPVAAIDEIQANRNVFLTGTPILNRPVELWTLIQKLDPNGLGRSFFKFALRYCAATKNKFGWDFKGHSNLDELQDYLRSNFMVRRLKADVLKDLPAKQREVVVVEGEGGKLAELLEKEKVAYSQYKAKPGSFSLAECSKLRKEVAIAKAPFVIEHVQDMLESVDKVIVFAHHHEVVDQLMAAFGSEAVKIDGRMTKDVDRQAAVDAFQTDPKIKVFVGSIMAAGVAITLTAASNVVFAELDWTPGNMTQAEDRAHRIGQVNSVFIQHVVFENSLDENMIHQLIEKQAVCDQSLDTQVEKPAAAPVEKPKVGMPEAPKPVAGKFTTNVKGQDVVLTQENIDAIHAGLRRLRAACDGAFSEDGHGFSGADVQFGWSLAAAPKLSVRQAGYGQRMIRKYQGQLPTELVLAAGVTPKEAK